MSDIDELAAGVEAATGRLLATVRTMGDADVGRPSLCAGWTTGHVLAHLSRNADGLTNLLRWAATGIEVPMYASSAARNADIEAGADRPIAEQLADLEATAAELADHARTLPPDRWTAVVRMLDGREIPAREVLNMRWTEVDVHHVDLDAGYGWADLRPEFLRWAIPRMAARLASRLGDRPAFVVRAVDVRELGDVPIGAGPPSATVVGPAGELVGWLTGRTAGAGLTTEPDSAGLPDAPEYG